MIFIISRDEILHNTPTLKYPDRLPVRERIGDGWNSAIRIDFEEPGLLLSAFAELDLSCFVR